MVLRVTVYLPYPLQGAGRRGFGSGRSRTRGGLPRVRGPRRGRTG